ncbi:branched-chain amino acid ABC transporter substrate-binding protein [Clavibacter michiganensis subsp. insidiosus]|uniref:Branched-chain amino acid ABC transporter substrate-binding protein n=1 Tax=Clavibacter michiganensis subsp. insidiosus TaxID=33014 RepID=A0A399N1V7_9MICO|nr:ABC transporter substrate-binding protein [Clavibacter michiganensis]AWG02492.1 branched-chain amino acid ABC transporter substrate-binding protein [Clavibacter michiganensis subsp. insidiosus]OQJ59066.1 branched-chain amino acid ABC transporter substrate-binding protein [Clavibacter michiganensis subsp. insidiosus]RII88115.1 branched-chain amino acid ABC transporter substrate-binding protein [Clavibacter michiganensis subsp. insidiosus]RIJ42290.1 branched-chain amino acid ABC transporter su
MSAFGRASASRSRSARTALSAVTIAVASALVLAGCSGGGGGGGTTADGGLNLKIGTILPQTGSLAVLGPPEFAGVDLAVKDINDAKAGITVTNTAKDSGDTTTDIASQSATSLIADGNSAIIGAASSGVSKTFIDQVTQAGVVQLSPANTSPDFTTYADDGYYWRTAPSDVLQGRILGNKMLQDGKTNVSILYMNDAYGTGLQENIKKTLEAGGATIAAEQVFEPSATDFNSAITSVLAPNPDALVVISFDEIKTIADQLASKGFDFSKFYGTDGNYGVIKETDTNVDIAGAQFTNPGVEAKEDFQTRLQDMVKAEGEPALTVFSYSAESYDGTVLLALAALQGKGTDGATLKENLQSVSEGGEKCTTFADCAKLIADGTDIDYDGLSGPITFDENGDPTEAYVSVYKYGTGNTTTFSEQVYGKLD